MGKNNGETIAKLEALAQNLGTTLIIDNGGRGNVIKCHIDAPTGDRFDIYNQMKKNIFGFKLLNGNTKESNSYDEFENLFRTYYNINVVDIPLAKKIADTFEVECDVKTLYKTFKGNESVGFTYIFAVLDNELQEIAVKMIDENTVEAILKQYKDEQKKQFLVVKKSTYNRDLQKMLSVNEFVGELSKKYGESETINISRKDKYTFEFDIAGDMICSVIIHEDNINTVTVEKAIYKGNVIVDSNTDIELEDYLDLDELTNKLLVLSTTSSDVDDIDENYEDNVESEDTEDIDVWNSSDDNTVENTEDSIEDTEDSIEDTEEVLDTEDSIEDTEEVLDTEDSIEDTEDSIEDTEDSIEDTEDSIEDTEEVLDTEDSIEDTEDSIEDTEEVLDTEDSIEDTEEVKEVAGVITEASVEEDTDTTDIGVVADKTNVEGDLEMEIKKILNGNEEIVGVRFTNGKEIYDMDKSAAEAHNIPLYKIISAVTTVEKKGMLITQDELDSKVFAKDITNDDAKIDEVIAAFFE